MKKVIIALLAVLTIIGITTNVYAEEVYYTTPNGIDLTREEYDFLTTFYGEHYLEVMTRDMYDEFVEDDLINSEVKIVKYDEPQLALLNPGISPDSQSHSTPAKTVQIGAACLDTYCIIDIQNNWHVSPSVRSWDNIGALLDGPYLISHNHTYVYSSMGTNFYNNLLISSHGLGNSVKLPTNGGNLIIDMAFKVTGTGTVYGSYQHAMQNTTLPNSQNYTVQIFGYGNVFAYYGTACGIYDGMNGVDIDI